MGSAPSPVAFATSLRGLTYRPELDGLRAVAVLPVLFFHAALPGFRGGYVGVDVFFVISGYLISSILFSELKQTNRISIRRFYERRVRRIFPALFFVVFATTLAAYAILSPAALVDYSKSLASVSVFGSNIYFWLSSNYFATAAELKPLLHTWSLSVEEQFYLFYPVMLMLLWRRRSFTLDRLLVAGTVLSFGGAYLAGSISLDGAFFLLPFRAWELFAGGLIAVYEHHGRTPTSRTSAWMTNIGLIMIAATMTLFDEQTRHPGLFSAIPIIGTAMVIAGGRAPSAGRQLLCLPPLVWMGLASYSIYLWHQPLFAFARYTSLRPITHADYLALIFIAIIFAWLSRRFVEAPFRDRQRFSMRTVWLSYALATCACLALATWGIVRKGLPQRFGATLDPVFEVMHSKTPQDFGYDAKRCNNRRPNQACIIGDRTQPPTWALLGDSHAGALAPGLHRAFKDLGISAAQVTISGCPYGIGLEKSGWTSYCSSRVSRARDFIRNANIDNVILTSRWSIMVSGQRFDNGQGGIEAGKSVAYRPLSSFDPSQRAKLVVKAYADSVRELLDMGKTVYLFYPVPEVGWDVPHRYFLRLAHGQDTIQTLAPPITTNMGVYDKRHQPLIDAFDQIEHAHLHRYKPAHYFCNNTLRGRCVTQLNGQLLYSDSHHLSDYGSMVVVRAFIEALAGS